MTLRNLLVTLGLAALTFACSGSGTRPHDMTIEGHKAAAKEAEKEADYHEHKAGETAGMDSYIDHWVLADVYREHARKHREAAKALAEAEDPEACVGQTREEMETCPLAGYDVVKVEKTETGIVADFRDAKDRRLRQQIRCHVAHAKMVDEQHEDADKCPLLGSVEVEVEGIDGGSRVRFTSDVAADRQRLHDLYVRAKK